MLNYAVYLRLYSLLGKISELTSQLKNTAGGYARSAEDYLNTLLNLADEHRLPVSSDIAVELQKLISFDGKGQQRNSPRKERDIFAVSCIGCVQQKVKSYLEKYDRIFTECADACRQLAAQITTFNVDALRSLSDADTFISAARTSDSLKPYYAQLIGAVGVFNLRAVFDSILPQVVQKNY